MSTPRGTTNRNDRGSSADRKRRREWLVETYRADQDLTTQVAMLEGEWVESQVGTWHGYGAKACRCYRCGTLLTVETVTVDRIIPGCKGGTYRRNNIRPACAGCNSETGGKLGASRVRRRAAGLVMAVMVACIALAGCDDHKGEHCTEHTTMLMPITHLVGKVSVITYMPITSCSRWEPNQ